MAFLIEHCAGAFPVWLSPTQVKIASVGQAHGEFCQKLAAEFRENGVRAEADDSDETVGNKIRKAVGEKVPYMLVVGDRGEKTTREIGKQEFIKEVNKKIKNRM